METFKATSDIVACSLSRAELEDTSAAWQKLFRLSLASRDEVPGGLRLVFHPGSADALRGLVDIERACCPWITFELDRGTLTMTSPGAGQTAIREMWVVKE